MATRMHPKSKSKLSGFTLLELIVTMFVMAILLTVGIPSFKHVIDSTNIASLNNQIKGGLNYARSEAITRNATVVLLPSNPNDWGSSGWAIKTASGEVLRQVNDVDDNYKISSTSDKLSFDSSGAAIKNGCITVKSISDNTSASYIKVMPTGISVEVSSC